MICVDFTTLDSAGKANPGNRSVPGAAHNQSESDLLFSLLGLFEHELARERLAREFLPFLFLFGG